MRQILLFDVDGVLVQPKAYRIAIRESVRCFFAERGRELSSHQLPTEELVSRFESIGVHDVWDIAAMFVALILLEVAPEKFDSILRSLRFPIQDGVHPPHALASLLRERFTEPAPDVYAVLEHTRSVEQNKLTALFQELLLGSAEFSEVYGAASSRFESSLLRTEDTALLTEENARLVVAGLENDERHACIFTARPSRHPLGIGSGYPPEAEIARESVALTALPLVGMGSMEWLAAEHRVESHTLAKPHATHAVAAILTALYPQRHVEMLEAAYVFCHRGGIDPTLLREPMAITLFEDTVSGITALQRGISLLRTEGAQISIRVLGIAEQSAKRATLSKVCEAVFDDINAALVYALQSNNPT